MTLLPAQNHVNILIVDDKEGNLLALENILKNLDLNIVKALSGNEALAKLLEIDFACILLDVQMPEMDGFELARIIRDDDRTRLIPIIFSSGHQRGDADVFKGYETGAVDYLMKPLDPIVVRSKVKVFADLYRKSAALTHAEAAMAKYASELKKYNNELEQRVADRMKDLSNSQAQMAQLQKMDAIGSLAGGMAHDFNNLLATITLYCDIIDRNTHVPDKVKKTSESIRSVAMKGASLTRQLLIFSRRQIIQAQNVELNTIVTDMQDMLMRLIGKNIEIVTRLGNGLDLIHADPSQIEQVILNLVVNARDAMPKGGTVTIETSRTLIDQEFCLQNVGVTPGPYVMLSVSDTGTGMDEATRARLFEPFFTTKPVGKGTGLGLPTVYGIIKQSKGAIQVFSELGNGSIFKIYFPSADGIAPEAIAHENVYYELGHETIFLVEDDDDLRALYKDTLEHHGYKVFVAANGKEALEILSRQQEKIHLLLSDVLMPHMGGFELAKQVAPLYPHLPILLMSGYTNETSTVENPSEAREMNFLQKPFSTEDLIAKIHEILNREAAAND